MDMSIDVKCSVTTAILTVLVYLLLVNIFSRVYTSGGVGQSMEKPDTEWYKSMEVFVLVSVIIAYNINNYLFTSCKA